MTYRQMLEKGSRLLDDSGIDEYDNDAFELLSFATGVERSGYILHKDEDLSDELAKRYEELIRKRSTRYPLQYITGEAWFYGNRFFVDENVLIPRFDTENLVELILSKEKDAKSFLDMCTGSGCIAVTIKDKLKSIEASASDISDGALSVAKKNADSLAADIKFIKSDLFENIWSRTYATS